MTKQHREGGYSTAVTTGSICFTACQQVGACVTLWDTELSNYQYDSIKKVGTFLPNTLSNLLMIG